MSYKFMERVFDSEDYVPLFKDHHVFISDGSKAEIPNLREVKEEFDVAPDTEKYTQPTKTLFSTLIDAKYGFVLDSILGKSRSSERDLLKKHLENVEKYVDFEKTIIVLDRGYVRQDRVYRLHLNVSVRILSILNPCCVGFPPLKLLIQ